MTNAIKFAIVTLAMVSTLASNAVSAEKKKVKIDDVPAAVKTAIEKAVGGGKLVDIGEVTADGKKTYEIEMNVDDKVIDHEGAWLHGRNNAQAGIMMPGECLIGAAYYQEYAPKQAMDRARIQEVDATGKTPAGEFSNCLNVWEENPLDGDSETRTFAPGVGLVQDEGLLLVKQGFVE